MNKPRSVSIRMEDRLYETINTIARNEGQTFSSALSRLLEIGIDKYRDIKQQEKEL